MALPVRPHHPTAPVTRSNRVLGNVVTPSASDPCLEFLSEDPGEAVVREPVFTIEPIPSEPPRHAAEVWAQDQFSGQTRNVRLRFLHPRTALLALYRGVVGALVAVRRRVVGTVVALHRGLVEALVAVRRRVVGAVVALYRGVVGALVAVRRGVVGAFVALYHGVVGALVAVRRGVVGAVVALYRGVVGALVAVRRRVVGAVVALYHGVVGALVASRRCVVGVLLALYRGVVKALLALHQWLVRALVALHHGVTNALLALHRGVVETLLSLRRWVVVAQLALYRSVVGALLALRGGAVGALQTLNRGVARTFVVSRQGTSEVARWMWSSCASVIEGATAFGASGVSRIRRVGGDVRTRGRQVWSQCGVATMQVRARLAGEIRTIQRLTSMAGRDLSIVARSLHERCRVSFRALARNAQRIASARQPLRMRMPLWTLKMNISQVRAPVINGMLGAFTGATAVGALVVWLGLQPGMPRPPDTGGPLGPDAVARQAPADDSAAAVYAATLVPRPVEPQATAPSFVAQPRAGMPAVVTVMSSPAGARVTIDGIGWGETPVTIRHLSPGPKVVRLTKEGYESQQQIVNVPDDRRPAAIQITLRTPSPVSEPTVMPAGMMVMSTPTGARVTVDGIGWGETPVTIRHLPPGPKVVRVTKEGYESQQTTVSVADGRPAPVRVTLRAAN